MNKKLAVILSSVGGVVLLAACGGAAATPTAAPQPAQAAQGQNATPSANRPNAQNAQQAALSPELKLMIGMFSLKDTPNALTKDQAGKLIPILQKIKDLDAQMFAGRGQNGQPPANPQNGQPPARPTTDPALTAQVDAALKDLQAALTPAQTQAIDGMNLTRDSMNAVLQAQGVQMGNGGPRGGNPNGNPPQGTPPAGNTTQRGNGGPSGAFGGLGGFGVPSQLIDALIQYLGQI